jgi:hypothetical protein
MPEIADTNDLRCANRSVGQRLTAILRAITLQKGSWGNGTPSNLYFSEGQTKNIKLLQKCEPYIRNSTFESLAV